MTGIQIEYLWGIYFFVMSLSYGAGKITVDKVKFIAGILLIVLALFGPRFV